MQENKGQPVFPLDLYEEKRQRVSRFHLTSDIFFSKVLEDKLACQEVIRILTSEILFVKAVKSQYSIRNMENRSVVLDVLAEDEGGRMINVEIHLKEDEDHVRRVRYHQSSIDMSCLEKGTSFEEIPDVYLIYITEKDFIGSKRGIYTIDRTIRETGQVLGNGVHEFYVNLSEEADLAEQRELLRYIVQSDSDYQTAAFPRLVERVRMYKDKKEGVEIMCEILEKEHAEGMAEGDIKGQAKVLTKIISMIRKKYNKSNTPAQASQALELEIDYVALIMDSIEKHPQWSDLEIALDLVKQEHGF